MSDIGSKKRIVDVATKLFSAQGVKNTNIRQIATKAKVNSALIFYHFGCKDKLFYACLEDEGSEKAQMAREVLREPQDRRDFELKVELFAQTMFSHFISKKDLIKILHRELENNNAQAIKVFESSLLPVAEAFGEFLKAAQSKGILREQIDPQILVWDYFGLMTNAMRNETVLKILLKRNKIKATEEEFLKESPRRILDLIFKGALK